MTVIFFTHSVALVQGSLAAALRSAAQCSFYFVPELSRDIRGDAGSLRNKAATLGDTIRGTLCTRLQFHPHILFKIRLNVTPIYAPGFPK